MNKKIERTTTKVRPRHHGRHFTYSVSTTYGEQSSNALLTLSILSSFRSSVSLSLSLSFLVFFPFQPHIRLSPRAAAPMWTAQKPCHVHYLAAAAVTRSTKDDNCDLKSLGLLASDRGLTWLHKFGNSTHTYRVCFKLGKRNAQNKTRETQKRTIANTPLFSIV